MSGLKPGTSWLALDNHWVLVPSGMGQTVSRFVKYRECRFRREPTTRYPFKTKTTADKDDDKPKIKDMMKTSFYSCQQDETHIIDIKFRNKIKDMASSNYKFNYARTFLKEKKDLLKKIADDDLRERVRNILPSQEELRSAAHRAKKRGIPVDPKDVNNMDFSLLNTQARNMSKLVLSHDKDSNIVLFGTDDI